MSLEMIQVWAMLVLLLCLNSVAGKNRLIESNKALMRIVDHLHVEIESCSGMFFCGYFKGYGAHCIPRQQVCDGFNNCDGGEDEAYCPPKKPKCIGDQVMCPHINRCALLCNGISECLSGIDERYCESKCKNGQVKCSDGKCAVVGDGKPECDDRADENCPVSPPCEQCEQCGVGELSCILKTSGKRKCVSTCDKIIECVFDEDMTSLPTCPSTCLPGWIRFEASCYKIVTDNNKNWAGAVSACKSMLPNAHLVAVESEMENTFLTIKLIEEIGVRNIMEFWMGATDVTIEGSYVWEHSNQPVDVTFYAPSQPNGNNVQNCLTFSGDSNYLWGDLTCVASARSFICEIEDQ